MIQLTRDTTLETLVAVDMVEVAPNQRSDVHRHNKSDTVLYILGGSAQVLVGENLFPVAKGERIHIAPGVYHGIITAGEPLKFLSVQTPPILDKQSDHLDLESRASARLNNQAAASKLCTTL